jgi:DNA adenine methylase
MATSSWKPAAVARKSRLSTDERSRDEEQRLLVSRDSTDASSVPAQPFLRWAGGKRWLLHHLPDILEGFEINGYHEPFLGGGAVFFGTIGSGQKFLSDLNGELIETYLQVRDNPELVAEALAEHVNTQEHYYKIRATEPQSDSGRAARFIYLNHTSYNGIYRVNLKGQYNVPYGNRTWGGLPSRELLISVSQKLGGVSLDECDFEKVASRAQQGDFVFLDPPYTVAHDNNGFVKYNQKLFSFEDQVRLSELIDKLRKTGAYYLLTNAAHDSIAELFEKGDRRIELSRGSSVGGKQAKRGSAIEYIFTNVPLS